MHAIDDDLFNEDFLVNCCDKSAHFISEFLDGQFSLKGPTEVVDTKSFIEEYAFELSIDYRYCARQKFSGKLNGESFIFLSDSILEQSLHLFYNKSEISNRENSRRSLAEKTSDLVLSNILSEIVKNEKFCLLSQDSRLIENDIKVAMEDFLSNDSKSVSRALHAEICNHTGVGHIQIVIFFY